MTKRLTFFTLLLILITQLTLMPATVFATKTKIKISSSSSINTLITRAQKNKTRFSVHLLDLSNNSTAYSFHADDTLMPASNMKIITTAAAINILGADFTYKTTFALWNNNLVILATGDPLTGDPVLAKQAGKDIFALFAEVLRKLQQKKITSINGNLLIDDTLFDDVRYCPSWPDDQANRWYAAQVSALNFNDNCIDINLQPATSLKQPAVYTTSPTTRYVNITNKCRTISRKNPNTAWASRQKDTNNITLRGNCNQPQTIYVAINRPSAYFGYVLAEYLLANKISIKGRLIIKSLRNKQGHLPPDMDIILTHRRPLKDIIFACNNRSLNLAAECLFKTMGAAIVTGNNAEHSSSGTGSWPSGRKAVAKFLTSLHISPQQYNIDDGSGLSHNNRLSARCITTVLAHIYPSKNRDLFLGSLASPASGTLSKHHRFSSPLYKGRIFAKTGYINGANSLSGFCKASSDKWYAFSILTNSPPAATATIDSIVKTIIAKY